MLKIDPRDAVPIWHQIELGVQRLVGTGALAPGASVPSVRELARDLRVNPMTVSKAYQRLAEAGVLEVRRGEGTFVRADAPRLGRADRLRSLREGALRYVGLAGTLGASRDEATGEVERCWDRERGGER